MSWGLSVHASGVGVVAGRMRGLAHRFRDPEPFFDAVERLLFEQSRERWRRNGFGWRPLDPDTIRRKARSKDLRERGNASRILRATGALERALTVKGAPGQKLERTPQALAFGFYTGGEAGRDVYYGIFPQKGKGEAKRVVLKATPKTRRNVQAAIREHLGLEG